MVRFHSAFRRGARLASQHHQRELASLFAALALAWPLAGSAAVGAEASFNVQRYVVEGDSTLSDAAIAGILAPATGPSVSIAEIREGLVSLRQAYRERGLGEVTVRMPRQLLGDGLVKLRVERPGGSPASVATEPATKQKDSSSFEIRHYNVEGDSGVTAEEIDRLLSPATGPDVSVERIRNALTAFQDAMLAAGRTNASIVLPRQLSVDGVVTVRVTEAPETKISPVAEAAPSPVATATNTPPERTFEVRGYEVAGNSVLLPDRVGQLLAPAIGPAVGLTQVRRALGDLQLAYLERGFATVNVGLPQQQLTNAVIKVQVTEGRLVDIRVLGNQHFSSNNVLRALPSLKTNALLNSRVLQRELDLANQNRDRQIFPTIVPGPEPGTSALNLKVKDRLPLHGRIEVNNQSTPGTPDWRVNASGQYNNLWQLDHQVGLSYGFTPEAFKSGGLTPDYFFNRPLISNYGGYYRLPFGGAESVQERIDGGGGFGYDEATRQFRLPPAGGRPDLTVFASASSSDTGVKLTPDTVVSQTPLLTIVSRDSGRNFSINEALGGRYSFPVALGDNRRLSLSAGPDWKRYFLESFNTNNFIITTVVTNAQGSQTIQSVVSSPQPLRRSETGYLPVSASADYFQNDRFGTFSANLGLAYNFVGESGDFKSLSYSSRARADYGKVTLNLSREHKFQNGWAVLARANGQTATGALISTEQFALGGLGSVRGYFDGDEYGDAGWFGSLEARTPYLSRQLPFGESFRPVWLRGTAFVDFGQRFLLEPSTSASSTQGLAGAGLGVSANLDDHFDLRITLGWPLIDSANTKAGDPRAYFSLGGQF